MKNTIGKKILTVIFVPFLLIFVTLSAYITATMIQYFTNWTELELKGISDINAAQLEGRTSSVRITVQSAAEIMENIDTLAPDARKKAEETVQSMFVNESVYNAWLVYEPNAFDGKDAEHVLDYPGAPSGRFMLSYLMEDAQIIIAPDMDEETIDDPILSPWYTVPRDENRLYIDAANNSNENLYDYGLGGDPVYTLSIVSPLRRDGKVIGCVGADVIFDTMTFGIDNAKNAAVAVFYSDGRVFYAEDIRFAEESVDTLRFTYATEIKQTMADGASLFLAEEYCPFLDEPAFTYFHLVRSEGIDESSLYLYVALPRTALFDSLGPIFILVAAVALTVLAALLVVFVYIIGRISRPIKELTLSADDISQGRLESEVAYFPESQGEIGTLSRSLRRMVEQFRVYITEQEQSREEMTINSMLHVAAGVPDASESFRELAIMFGRHFKVYRVTMVLLFDGKASIMAQYDSDEDAPTAEYRADFINHKQIMNLLLPDRKLVFLNTFGIKTKMITFVGEKTISVCIVPLKEGQTMLGYMIFENKDRKNTFTASTESALFYTAGILAEWIARSKQEAEIDPVFTDEAVPMETDESVSGEQAAPEEASAIIDEPNAGQTHKEPLPYIALISEIEGLHVDAALEAMGGIAEIYEQSVRLFAQTTQEAKERMDAYLHDEDMKAFTIEVHGAKGALNNIGATEIGSMAARLESAAQNGDVTYCTENYDAFATALMSFYEQLEAAAGRCDTGDKEAGDRNRLTKVLTEVLTEVRAATKGFDSLRALEILSPVLAFSYGAQIDTLVAEIVRSLEIFDCESALRDMDTLQECLCGDTGK